MSSRNPLPTLSSANPAISTTASNAGLRQAIPPMLRLPTELMRMVFEECDEDDDLADSRPDIRLTCKDFEPIVAEMLAEEWSGHLYLRLCEQRMIGLGGISTIFGSHLKRINLCTDRLNHIPSLREELRGRLEFWERRRIMEKRNLTWKPKKFTLKRAILVKAIDKHNRAVEQQHAYFMTAAPLAELTQALMVLSFSNHNPSLSIHDEQWRWLDHFRERLDEFDLTSTHTTNDYSSILQVLANAVKLSRYPLSVLDIHLTTGRLPANNIQPADVFWERLTPIPNITIMLRPEIDDGILREPSPMVTKVLSNGTHLDIRDQCFVSKDDRIPNPVFGEQNYGALHGYIRNKSFSKVTMWNVNAHYDFLDQDLNLTPESLESLQMLKVSFSRHLDGRGWLCTSLSFFLHLKTFTRLITLILEEITEKGSHDIQKKRVEWTGQDQIQRYLDGLITKETYEYT
ncbi:hypothetical protein E4T39_03073 [Aureobasidium subglaciale]|nr:hypothetical protein E4T39_03073 [Aureobasidium subglaciale]